MEEQIRIVFMGTPDFAVESLRTLVEKNYNVVGVITMPDKKSGRGQKMRCSAVKEYAISQNLNILQPSNLKDENFIKELKSLQADLQIVVAFRMLPEIVWTMPKYGTFNLHASLLPQYRGAAPVNWAIINGEKETGATTFFLQQEIDTGNIILQKKIDILPTDNVGDVHDKLMVLGANMVCETVDLIARGEVETRSQNDLITTGNSINTAPKLFKESCELKSDKSVIDAHNFVRGLSPYPVAWCYLRLPNHDKELNVKIYKTQAEITSHSYTIGEILLDKKSMKIALKDGFLEIKELQISGKKRMKITDFLNGLQL